MGLDMYAYSVEADSYDSEVDFDQPETATEIKYWRKFNELRGVMESLYREKGGSAESFNCVNVNLTKEDIDQLRGMFKARKFSHTHGFFFGSPKEPDEAVEEVTKFCELAEAELSSGRKVFYTSWW